MALDGRKERVEVNPTSREVLFKIKTENKRQKNKNKQQSKSRKKHQLDLPVIRDLNKKI